MVVATQNPIEQEGTYPLPEAQLDRFMVKIPIGYPSREQEVELVELHGHGASMPRIEDFELAVVADLEFIVRARTAVAGVQLSPEVRDYVVDIVRATREHPSLSAGASPRATNMLSLASRAAAVLAGRDYVLPDDVKKLLGPVLAHRLVLAPGAELEALSTRGVLKLVVEQIAAPR